MCNILKKYSQINRNVSSSLWNKIIWNPDSKTMLVNNQILLKYLFVYLYKPSILREKHVKDFYHRYKLVKSIDIAEIDNHLNNLIKNA